MQTDPVHLSGRKRIAVVLYASFPTPSPGGELPNRDQASLLVRRIMDSVAVASRLTLAIPGSWMEAIARIAPRECAELRERGRAGEIEFLAMGYHGALPPLWPTELSSLALRLHKEIIGQVFGCHARGYLPPMEVWEPATASLLSDQALDFLLLPSDALPIGARCLVAEDLGNTVHVVSWDRAASLKTMAAEKNGIAEMLAACPPDDTLVLCLPLDEEQSPVQALDAIMQVAVDANVELVWRAVAALLDNTSNLDRLDLATWSACRPLAGHGSHSDLRQLRSMRAAVASDPRCEYLHKKCLSLYRAIQDLDEDKSRNAVLATLLPATAEIFYHPGESSLDSILRRAKGHALALRAENLLDELGGQSGSEVAVQDTMGVGDRQITCRNQGMSLLVEHRMGGRLRALEHRRTLVNILPGVLHSDGVPLPALGASDALHPFAATTTEDETLFAACLAGGSPLEAPYDYQIKRLPERTQILLSGEQGADIGGHVHSFRCDKVFAFPPANAELLLGLALTNGTFHQFRGSLSTAYDFTLPGEDPDQQIVVAEGLRWKPWDGPKVRHGVRQFEIRDRKLGLRLVLEFRKPCSLVAAPLHGPGGEPQALRVMSFWDLDIRGQETGQVQSRLRIRRYRSFLP